LTANRQVENHRNLFPTIWAIEGMFHVSSGNSDPPNSGNSEPSSKGPKK
jgi:hypothetical protein